MNTTTLKFFFSLLCLAISVSLVANTGNNFLNKGNTQYLKGNLDDALKLYSKADNSCITEKDKIENNKALVFAQKGKLKLAIDRLTTALEQNPNNANANYNRGLIHIQTNNYKQAIEDLENAKFLGIENGKDLVYNLSLSYYLNGQLDEAQVKLDETLDQDAKTSYLRGMIAYQRKDFAGAASAFNNSLRQGNHPEVRYANALANYYAGNSNQGLVLLDKLKGEKLLHDKVQMVYAHLALESHDISKAKAAYQSIIKSDKRNAQAHAGLGQIALLESDNQLAEKYFKQALKIQAGNETALEGLAQIEFLNGKYEKSVETFDKLLLHNPNNQRALYGKALSAMHRPDPYTCLDALAKINKKILSPKQIEKVVLLEARALGICNKKQEAIALLNKYRSLAQDKKQIKILLAYYNLRMFRYATAVNHVGISKFDNYLPYLIAGHASLHRGQFSTAYRYYRKAYKLDNKDPDVLMGAAMCMMELDMRDEALRVIDSLEARFPENYYVFNAKGIVYKDLGLYQNKRGNKQQADRSLETAERAFARAKELRPPMASSFDNNIGLTYFYRNNFNQAKALFDGSNRLASKNNRALLDVSIGDYPSAIRRLDSLHRDFIRMNDLPNNKVKNNLDLANKKARMANNYKFITYYFLHQDPPAIDQLNPFGSTPKHIDLSSDLKPELNYILEYSEAECEEEKKDRKKKKKSKPKLKFLKKKKSTKCPTFKT